MFSLLQLPQPIWRDCVACFLSQVKELARLDCALTNKIDRATFHANISGCKRFTHYHFNGNNRQLKWLASRNIIVKVIQFTEEPGTADKPSIGQLLLCARTVHFIRNSLSPDGTVLHWLCFNSLNELYFDSCPVADVSALSAFCSLTCLQIRNCPNITEQNFAMGIAGCTKLNTCTLRYCKNLHATAVIVLLQSCSELKTLSLGDGFDIGNLFERVSNSNVQTHLESFYGSGYSCKMSHTGAAMQRMAFAFPTLTTLSLDYPHNTVTDVDIDILVRSCKSLTDIKLPNLARITDASFCSIAQHLPGLKKLHIEQCGRITNIGVIALARATSQLLSLDLKYLPIFNDAVQTIGTHCKKLRHLSVSKCSLLTDDAFNTLNVVCLETLDISGTRVTGTFAAHVLSSASTVDVFFCSGGEHLNSAFVHSLTCNTKVYTLALGSNHLSESDWIELSRKFPKLWNLTLTDSKAVTDAVVLSFRQHCQELSCVSVDGCSVSPGV